MKALLTPSVTALILHCSSPCFAQFAEPPRGQVLVSDSPQSPYDDPTPEPKRSTVRAALGPVIRANDADVGLLAALEFGPRRTGFRASAAWVQVGSDRGLSQYTGELWIDFVERGPFHPVLGAGAGLARLETEQAGVQGVSHVGIGVASARLEYLLPIEGTDARAALGLSGALPAIRGENDPVVDPWLLVAATLGVGF